jgi:hypothetical protein
MTKEAIFYPRDHPQSIVLLKKLGNDLFDLGMVHSKVKHNTYLCYIGDWKNVKKK